MDREGLEGCGHNQMCAGKGWKDVGKARCALGVAGGMWAQLDVDREDLEGCGHNQMCPRTCVRF